MKKISRLEIEKDMKEFSKNIKDKSPKEIKKIKRIAMSYNIPLRDLRKKFCKKCLMPYSGKEKIRIKNGIKSVECLNCKNIARWKMKN